VLRSLTKEHALAGLRLGYLLGSPETLTPLRVAQPPWSVSTAAQVAGLAAPLDAEHLKHAIAATRSLGARLHADLRATGLEVLPTTDTHYALVNVGDSLAFARSLLERRILVRSGASFGLPAYIRVAPRLAVDNERLLEANCLLA
jgi:histidinol-phosphate/aromatic aminotransferase/cobyric acid decarboxylase-like protein